MLSVEYEENRGALGTWTLTAMYWTHIIAASAVLGDWHRVGSPPKFEVKKAWKVLRSCFRSF